MRHEMCKDDLGGSFNLLLELVRMKCFTTLHTTVVHPHTINLTVLYDVSLKFSYLTYHN
jgi:hypothetical protein